LLIAVLVWAQSPDLYPARGHVKGATIAAVALTPALTKAAFGSNLYKDYLVIEVAVFPDADGSLKLSTKDFVLKTSEAGDWLRSVAPSTIAMTIDEKNNPKHPPDIHKAVDVTTTNTVEYQSGSKRQGGGVYTGTEVDVGPAGRTPTPPSQHRGPQFDDMENELSARALPETIVKKPVTGFLYFFPPKKKEHSAYTLDYSGDAGEVKLTVPHV
jgi:hypothetical protein